MSISSRCIERPVAVAMLFLAIAMLGIISFARLPIDLLPDVSYPRLVVYTTYPDVGPSEVERFVTEPIERQVARVPGTERVESVSREGVSLVTLRFAWGTDMDFAVLNVREQLDNLRGNLPEMASRPAVLRTDPSAEPIMAVSVAARGDLAVLKELAETVFKRRLEQVDGVAEAALAGGLEREIHVEVNPRLLDSYGFTIQDIGAVLDAANQSAPGGRIRRGRYTYALRTLGEFQTVDEIADVPLGPSPNDTTGAGNLVLLRDVATVEDGFRDRESIARYNGHEAVGLLLFKESGSNTVRVADRVNEVLDQLRAEYPEVQLDVAMSQAGFITDAISNVVQALVFGGILAFLVLFFFLRHARYPIAVALAIPISVIASFALLDLANVSLNIMSLGGLALGVGMLVDNSIVVLENVFRHGEAGAGANEAAARGAEEVQGAITASTLTTISVFGPIIYIEGVAGELFGALSFAVAFALMASLIVALTLLPTMAARWVPGTDATKQRSYLRRLAWSMFHAIGSAIHRFFRPLLDWFDRRFAVFAEWYHGLLEKALDNKGRVVGFAALTLFVGVAIGATLDRSVLPDVDQGAFRARLDLPRGTAIDETAVATERLEEIFLADPGVDAVFTRVGRQEAVAGVEDEESGLNTAVLEVRLKPRAGTSEAIDRVRPALAQFPVGTLTLETGTATALGRILGGSEADLAVRVGGDDLDAAWVYAQEVERRLQPLSSLTNVRMAVEEGQPELLVEIDRERAAAFGIEPQLIAQTIENSMSGLAATEFVDFDEKVPVVIRLPENQRRSAATLDVLQVNGIPLRQLVTSRETVGPAEIRRLEQARTVTVYADAAASLDDALSDVRAILSANPAPRGLRVEVGGENEERDRSFRDLAFAFGLALLLVYMILAAQFESFVHPFTILLSVPLATVGAAAALFIAGQGLNSMSLIGLVILVGIVVNDAIVKVDFINQMRRAGLPLREAILEAGRVRLRPIVMTTVTTVLGLTPMALGWGRGADLRAPLAIAVIGGLISATALTLIVVPVAYDLLDDMRQKIRAAFGFSAVAAGITGGVATGAGGGAGVTANPGRSSAGASLGRHEFGKEGAE
ncbi:MAG: efflux RND transporter permease subunit [Gemmatimonadales bacterium]|jgi:HAE1 family hydrophobic/amphiphilic exporter-1